MIIDIFCGPCWEAFTPASLETAGIGGSETAVVHMARELARLGASVYVWGESFGDYGNVRYRHYKQWHPERATDVLVSWRNVVPFTQKGLRARHRVLWLHDLGLPTLPEGLANEIDRIAVLSEFHGRAVVRDNPILAEKLWRVGNGIDAQWYTDVDFRDKKPNWFFYSSSPRRGLAKLLAEWPEVRTRFPSATLHVAYGFELTLKMEAQHGNHYAVRAYERMLKQCKETEGAVYHGRLSHGALAGLQKRCSAWLYPPSDFEETFCITALEAQTAKAWPISRANGSLPEVLRAWTQWDAQDRTVDVIDTFYSDPPTMEMVNSNYDWAMEHTWAAEAARWKAEFDQCLR